MPKVIQVIESHVTAGNGVDDPYRAVMQYHTLEGDLLAEHDTYIVSEKAELDRQREEIKDLHKFFVGVRDVTHRAMTGRPVNPDASPSDVFVDVRGLLDELTQFRRAKDGRYPKGGGLPEPDRN